MQKLSNGNYKFGLFRIVKSPTKQQWYFYKETDPTIQQTGFHTKRHAIAELKRITLQRSQTPVKLSPIDPFLSEILSIAEILSDSKTYIVIWDKNQFKTTSSITALKKELKFANYNLNARVFRNADKGATIEVI